MLFLIFLIVFLLAVLILLIVYAKSNADKRDRCRILNQKANEQLKSAGFQTSKVLFLTTNANVDKEKITGGMICVDSENKKIAFCDYSAGSVVIVNFDEFLDYEVYNNGTTVTTGGSVGWWGRLYGAETTGKCKELRLIVRLKQVEKSQITYELVSDTLMNAGLAKDSGDYKQIIASLQEVVSFLEVVKSENKKV